MYSKWSNRYVMDLLQRKLYQIYIEVIARCRMLYIIINMIQLRFCVIYTMLTLFVNNEMKGIVKFKKFVFEYDHLLNKLGEIVEVTS